MKNTSSVGRKCLSFSVPFSLPARFLRKGTNKENLTKEIDFSTSAAKSRFYLTATKSRS